MKNIFKSYKTYTFIAIIILLSYLFFFYFRITSISISGRTYGYNAQITSLLNRIDRKKSIFLISNKTFLSQIMSLYPIVSSVKISKKFPSLVNVKINSNNIVYTYIYKGKSYFIGSNGGYITGNIANVYPMTYSYTVQIVSGPKGSENLNYCLADNVPSGTAQYTTLTPLSTVAYIMILSTSNSNPATIQAYPTENTPSGATPLNCTN